jgi:dUTP pyrophosphatase
LAWNNFIDVGAGVIDEDYRGNIKIVLFNFSDIDFEVGFIIKVIEIE